MSWEETSDCCFCGDPVTEATGFVQGKVGTICTDCVTACNTALVRILLGEKAPRFPMILNCLSHGALRSIIGTDGVGLGNPAFILRALFGKTFEGFVGFLEHVFSVMNLQVDSAAILPEGFENGLVHALVEGRPLCEFSPNTPACWPNNQTFTTAERNFEGVTCRQCEFLIVERFPPDPATPSLE